MNGLRRVKVLMPGTCGELVQGTINGTPFLVSCPIDVFSAVTVELGEDRGGISTPADAPKAAAALRLALAHFGRTHLSARLTISSPLPRGKGMASSTADIAGTIYATAIALERYISPQQAAALALAIEPTDSSVFPNLAIFDHRGGRLYQELGTPPPIDIIVLDFGGEIDTITFNNCDRSAILRRLEPQTTEALRLVRRGIAEGRPELVGQGATISAQANQQLLPKPQLDTVLNLAHGMGAIGINVGHSGTVIGILVDRRHSDPAQVLAQARQELLELEMSFVCRLVGGGYKNGYSRVLPSNNKPLLPHAII
ncbi:MAG: GHMP kinase [Chloroflexi bacterium]|nr:GHMP kinase [Chloroflexota bacterium]